MTLNTLWKITAYPDSEGPVDLQGFAVTADYAAAAIKVFQEAYPDHAVSAVECLYLELVARVKEES